MEKKKIRCEICSQLGNVRCKKCKFTWYCTEEHQAFDWKNIHEMICEYLKELITDKGALLTALERDMHKEKRREIKLHIISVCRERAAEMLWDKRYSDAVVPLMQQLRWVSDTCGSVSIEAIDVYHQLAQTCLGIGSLAKADEYIGQALWCFQKGFPSNQSKYRVYCELGKVYEAHGQLEEAQDPLAEHVFYAAEEWGPRSMQTVWGYLHLGLSFIHKPVIAHSFFAKVIEITKKYVIEFLKKYIGNKIELPPISWEAEKIYHTEDLLEMMETILKQLSGPCSASTTNKEIMDLNFLLGTFHHLAATNNAKKFLQLAIKSGEEHNINHETLVDAQKMMQKEEMRLSRPLQNKIIEAMLWEGMPGTWHSFSDGDIQDVSHTDLIRYYGMTDDDEVKESETTDATKKEEEEESSKGSSKVSKKKLKD